MIQNVTRPGLESLDGVAFGENPAVPAVGKTDSANYEAIAQAINRRTAAGRGTEDVPTGQIITMMGKTAPAGYLACDGGVYSIADYPRLAAYFAEQFQAANYWGGDGETTFGVPDLRGEFLRGAGTNAHAEQGSGAAVGAHQDATEHAEYLINIGAAVLYTNGVPASGFYRDRLADGYVDNGAAQRMQVNLGSITVYSPETHYLSRPTNTSVLYCIKT